MKGLRLQVGSETRIFSPTGEVAVVIDGEPVVRGRWRSQSLASDPKDNKIRYDLAGVEQEPVPVRWRFNRRNQLEAIIPAVANGGTDSEPFAFLGAIEIDDAHDITYRLVNSEGQFLPRTLVLYGDLRFNADNNLVIDFIDGGAAEITGASPLASIEAARNTVEALPGDDLLRFRAITMNQLSSGKFKPYPAKIELVGNWDLQQGQLVFASKVTGDLTHPDVVIGFGGKIKAVSAGFAYYADAAGSKLAFTVRGEHRWNSTTASWDFGLGYSGKTLEASFKPNVTQTFADGREVTLTGVATIHHTNGTTAAVDAQLNAAYRWSSTNTLAFIAQVSSHDDMLNYDLGLEGNFVYKGGTLTFQIKHSNRDADDTVQLQLAFRGNEASLVQALSLLLDVNEDKINVALEFELRMTWVDGKLVKRPLAAVV